MSVLKVEVISMGSKFKWKKVAEKFLKHAVIVVIAGLAATYGDNQLYLVAAPALAALENFIKHRND